MFGRGESPRPFLVMEEQVASSMVNGGMSATGNFLGSVANYLFGELAADSQLERQKKLFDYTSAFNLPSAQFQRLIDAGLTPAAAAQSVAGQQNNISMPTVSPRPIINNGLDELGNHIIDSKLKTSEIFGNRADTANTIRFGEWIDPLYRHRIDNLISNTMDNLSHVGLNRHLSGYYYQLAEQIKEQRPWQLQTTITGLQNLAAMIDERIANKKKIEQDTKTSAALEGLYTEQQKTEQTQQELNRQKSQTEENVRRNLDADTYLKYSMGLNEDQKGFALMFDNQIRSMGWNPSASAAENLKRLALTDPQSAKPILDNLLTTANRVDTFLKSQFGKNYKRRLKLLAGAAFGHYAFNKSIDTALRRFGSFTGSIGNLLPFAHPQPTVVRGYR